jgi:small subunit ribosomal protein S6
LKRPYETIVIFDGSLPDDAVKAEHGKVEEFLSKNAEFEKADVMGKRHLAYPIRKKKMGIYYLYLYKGEGDVAGKLEKFLKLNDRVLRHLSVVRSSFVPRPPRELRKPETAPEQEKA